jgi:hypothetical protein
VAVGGDGLHVFDEFALVPDVVAGGDDVGAQVEEIFGEVWGDAEAASGVFAVDDGEIDLVALAYVGEVFADDLRPALPKTSPTKRIFIGSGLAPLRGFGELAS